MVKTFTMDQNTLFTQCPGSIVSDMDGEKVMLSISNGKYYNLGDVGGDIWELLKTPISISGIIKSLTQEYDVEIEDCTEQVHSFIEHLYKEKLIEKAE
ncbi:lasso peptide biosynthesis PqqD family chaperone [Peribacillus kribbensis]|uniref:lasso peptide biosynthesis PqqD family chaperone n=1 Tax=Peribacillus kribbensis TaxID=356658 RepID=UPI0004165AD1|nr:lasso peptide biosynthesis PqqD family chaperone [Peribacillus kribbensis]